MNREDYEKIAEEHNCVLSPYADKIINRVNLCNGYCPCVSEKERNEHPENNYMCPCSLMEKDLEEQGHCHCRLFMKVDKDA